VSFFGPFYSGYNVIAIDEDYRYALVAGKSLKYLWILSRETTIPENIKQSYLQKAKEIGFDVSVLVWTEQNSR
jgi:apolipoprotein D and lipocalin family protein